MFEHRWDKSKTTILLYFLDREAVLSFRKNYLIKTNGTSFIDSKKHSSISNFPPSRIQLEFSFNCCCSDKISNQNDFKYSHEIKFDGIQRLADESVPKLKSYVIAVLKILDFDVSMNDFIVRRINNTESCIVTFNNFVLRNNIFYSFLRFIKTEKSHGINQNRLPDVPCSNQITFNDQLSFNSRLIYNFCRQLKRNNTISHISTRRGRVGVKLTESDNWSFVTSLDELFTLINSNKDSSSSKT